MLIARVRGGQHEIFEGTMRSALGLSRLPTLQARWPAIPIQQAFSASLSAGLTFRFPPGARVVSYATQ